MSYRSFKRVLGETSLQRKCLLLFGGCLPVLIAAGFWWYGLRAEELVREQNRITGQRLVDQVMLEAHWEGWHADEAGPTPESPAARRLGRHPELIPELIKSLAEQLSRQKYKHRVLSPNAGNERGRKMDDDEQSVLEEFVRSPPRTAADAQSPEFREKYSTDGQEYHYYQPIRVKESCLDCHATLDSFRSPLLLGYGTATSANPPLKAGDVIAVVKIMLPNEIQEAMARNRSVLLATAIATVFLAMIAFYVIVRYVIVKPLSTCAT